MKVNAVHFITFRKIDGEIVAEFDGLGIGVFHLNQKRLKKHIQNRKSQGFDTSTERATLNNSWPKCI